MFSIEKNPAPTTSYPNPQYSHLKNKKRHPRMDNLYFLDMFGTSYKQPKTRKRVFFCIFSSPGFSPQHSFVKCRKCDKLAYFDHTILSLELLKEALFWTALPNSALISVGPLVAFFFLGAPCCPRWPPLPLP